SYTDRNIPADWAVMGEVGLAGEVRAIAQMERRVMECLRLGFTHILCPRDNLKGMEKINGVQLHGVDTVAQAMAVMDLLPGN
ncbi:MAG: DNA repair protein RadA, partial [Clostridia bacterium]|nr:DNA repair protein RadA [Clostridia bacterium]